MVRSALPLAKAMRLIWPLLLRAKGFRVIRRVVYAARPSTALPNEAQSALKAGRIHAAHIHFAALGAGGDAPAPRFRASGSSALHHCHRSIWQETCYVQRRS